MTTAFTISGSIFGLISAVCFRFSHTTHGLSFVILGLISFTIALFANLNKKKKSNKTEINLHKFTFVDPPGYYSHPKYPNQMICPHCLIKSHLISPVSKIDNNFWCCNVCNKPLSGSKDEIFTVPY